MTAEAEIDDAQLAAMTLTEHAARRHRLGPGTGNPNGAGRRVGSRTSGAGVMGEADDPWSRAALVQELTRAGRYGAPGGSGIIVG
jgi:hypothetical protein